MTPMKPVRRIFSLIYVLTVSAASLFAQEILWHKQQSSVLGSLRGLHVLNDSVVWASGAKGTVLRTQDGGGYWEVLPAPDSLDFRSIWAFSAREALVASAGQPARVFHTLDAGQHWELVYQDSSGEAFFDALYFMDNRRGWLLSDPVKGVLLLLETLDGGKSWYPRQMPRLAEGEAFFAASNGSIATAGSTHAWIGTGGTAIRVLATADAGANWQEQQVPLQRLSPASGIYALAFASVLEGVAVGGAYDLAEQKDFTACYTTNGGKEWKLPLIPPRGYRSGIAHLPGKRTFVAVGTTGADITTDGGKTWKGLNNENLNSIRFSPEGSRGWAVGSGGRIFMLDIH